ncbi:hypothetical protein [Streptodolium elevatio]
MASLDDELARLLRRRRRRPGKWVLLAVAALVAAYVAAVGVHTLTTDDLAREDTCVASYAEDGGAAGQLRDALRRVEASGTGAQLAELAPGDWDAVYAFSAGLVVAQPGDAGHGALRRAAHRATADNYPRLPVREGGDVFAWCTAHPNTSALGATVRALVDASSARIC